MIRKYIKNNSELKIIDLFLTYPNNQFNLTEIREKAQIKWDTAKKSVLRLVKIKMLEKGLNIRKSPLYKLNKTYASEMFSNLGLRALE